MSIRLGAAVAVSALLFAGACRAPAGLPDSGLTGSLWLPDSAAVLADLEYSGMASETRVVLTSPESWVATWAQLYAPFGYKPARPDVDFATQRVLVVAQGWQGTGGFDIRIDSLVAIPMRTWVYVTAVAPGRGCITTQLVTQPVQAMRVPQSLEPFAFRERSVVRDCQ